MTATWCHFPSVRGREPVTTPTHPTSNPSLPSRIKKVFPLGTHCPRVAARLKIVPMAAVVLIHAEMVKSCARPICPGAGALPVASTAMDLAAGMSVGFWGFPRSSTTVTMPPVAAANWIDWGVAEGPISSRRSSTGRPSMVTRRGCSRTVVFPMEYSRTTWDPWRCKPFQCAHGLGNGP